MSEHLFLGLSSKVYILIAMYLSLLSQMRKIRIKVVFRNSRMVLSNSCSSTSQVAHSALYNTTYIVLSVTGCLSLIPFFTSTLVLSVRISKGISFFMKLHCWWFLQYSWCLVILKAYLKSLLLLILASATKKFEDTSVVSILHMILKWLNTNLILTGYLKSTKNI